MQPSRLPLTSSELAQRTEAERLGHWSLGAGCCDAAVHVSMAACVGPEPEVDGGLVYE